MQRAPDVVDAERALLAARVPCLHYFHALLERGVPCEAAGEVHAQRLLVLYLCVVGCDLLRDEWLPSASIITPPERSKSSTGASSCRTTHVASVSPLSEAIEAELEKCYNQASGGFHPVHVARFTTSASLSMTHCALHVLLVTGALSDAAATWLAPDQTLDFVLGCQDVSTGGYFAAPGITECDVRFTYSAFMCFTILRTLRNTSGAFLSAEAEERMKESMQRAIPFIMGCWRSGEGGFAGAPNGSAEAHGGMTFCAMASLAVAKATLGLSVPAPLLARVRRYTVARVARGPDDEGLYTAFPTSAVGFQGRPCKSCDTCYTHWLGATLRLLQRGEDAEREEAGEMDAALVAQFCVLSLDAEEGGLGVMGRSTDVEPDIVHATLGLSGVLLVLAGSGIPLPQLWQSMAPPHPVYGCSEETARMLFPHCPSLLAD